MLLHLDSGLPWFFVTSYHNYNKPEYVTSLHFKYTYTYKPWAISLLQKEKTFSPHPPPLRFSLLEFLGDTEMDDGFLVEGRGWMGLDKNQIARSRSRRKKIRKANKTLTLCLLLQKKNVEGEISLKDIFVCMCVKEGERERAGPCRLVMTFSSPNSLSLTISLTITLSLSSLPLDELRRPFNYDIR